MHFYGIFIDFVYIHIFDNLNSNSAEKNDHI